MSCRDGHRKGRTRAVSGILLGILGLIVILIFILAFQFLALPRIHAYQVKYQPDETLHPEITGSPDPLIAEMLLQVNESEIYRTVSDLQDIPTRAYGTPGNREAADYLTRRLSEYPNLSVEYQGGEFRNIIATLPDVDPASGEILLVGAHYDSISSDPARAPGVTDNACGVGIVMELARVMSPHRFNRTVGFAFWNAEEGETGVYGAGSRSYASEVKDQGLDIVSYLNYDSACYDPENRSVIDLMYNRESRPFAEEMIRANTLYGINNTLTFNIFNCFSDHRSFWSEGYPAIMTHSESHGSGETPRDTLDRASIPYAARNARLGLATLAQQGRTGIA